MFCFNFLPEVHYNFYIVVILYLHYHLCVFVFGNLNLVEFVSGLVASLKLLNLLSYNPIRQFTCQPFTNKPPNNTITLISTHSIFCTQIPSCRSFRFKVVQFSLPYPKSFLSSPYIPKRPCFVTKVKFEAILFPRYLKKHLRNVKIVSIFII